MYWTGGCVPCARSRREADRELPRTSYCVRPESFDPPSKNFDSVAATFRRSSFDRWWKLVPRLFPRRAHTSLRDYGFASEDKNRSVLDISPAFGLNWADLDCIETV